MRLALGCLIGGVLTCVSTSARAEPARLSLHFNAPAGCPSESEVVERVERLLGNAHDAELARAVVVEASVERTSDAGFELTLVSGDHEGTQRRVSASSCEELADVAALFTALAVDPTLNVEAPAAPTSTPEAASAEPALPTPAPEPLPPAVAQPLPRAPAGALRVRPTVAALGVAAIGPMPGLALGAAAEGGVVFGHLDARGHVAFFPERHATASATAGGDLWLGTLGARAAYEFSSTVPRVHLGAGLTLGWLHGTGTGVVNSTAGNLWLVSFDPAARAGLPLSRSLSLFLDAQASVALNRPRFVVEETVEVHRPARAGARFGLGLEWRAP